MLFGFCRLLVGDRGCELLNKPYKVCRQIRKKWDIPWLGWTFAKHDVSILVDSQCTGSDSRDAEENTRRSVDR